MGPMFYLVQSHGALRPISAVMLADWPHEFALAPFPGKGGAVPSTAGSTCSGFPRPRRPAALGEKAWREIRAI